MPNDKKSIGILGSTGSIGKSACSLMLQNQTLSVEFLTCNSNLEELSLQIQSLSPKAVCVNAEISKQVSLLFPKVEVHTNLTTLLKNHPTDITLHAISGIAGITCVVEATANTQVLAIANKEAIVSAWKFIEEASIKHGTQIIPVDSEHNSLYRILELIPQDAVSKIGITASGGAFFGKKFHELGDISPRQALLHPTWKMGVKNTIDSSTMANKALELIEAMQLFACKEEYIDVVIHRQSIVHANVWLNAGGVLSFSSKPDMKLHIAHAIFENHQEPHHNVLTNSVLEFHEIKQDEFPIFFIGRGVAKTGNSSKYTIFNVANEVATTRFINGEIKYTQILSVIENALNTIEIKPANSINDLLLQIEEIQAKV